MDISLSTQNNHCVEKLPFPGIIGRTTRRSIAVTARQSFMEERVLHNGFSVYVIEFFPSAPVVMASDSWPTGFAWIFLLSGHIFYHHDAFEREIRMQAGMNRLAFQPEASGSAMLFPGDPIRIITITLSRKQFTRIMAQDVSHLPKGFSRACHEPNSPGIFALNHNNGDIQAALSRLTMAFSCAKAPALLLEGLALELMGLQTMLIANGGDQIFSPQEQDKIMQAKNILIDAMNEPPKLTELARNVGLTPNRLSRGFKEIYGTTPFAFLRQARLKRAYELLSSRQMNVTETAMAVGYESLSHFSKAFYNHFKQKPGEVKSHIFSY